TWAGESMLIIDATDVNENYRGQGVGRQLLDALVAFVREKDVKVIPLCPYAKSVFDKDPSIGDVLRK
ncbi:GNAT family N-acetyltransferase, partial [Acinetobacter baumannii]|nr:N-acetyltransferase [Acinetobacter baumannii]